MRALERSSERTAREMDIRADLRRWDQQNPEIHHELIVRWLCGAAASIIITSIYEAIRRPNRSERR